MTGLHDQIMQKVVDYLSEHMTDDLPVDDPSRVKVVKPGFLQGDPDPDEARIFLTVFENDPDTFVTGAVTSFDGKWQDEIEFGEIGSIRAVNTWIRRFTVKARLLLETTRESEAEARALASVIRTRIEHLLPQISFSGIDADGEKVSHPVYEMFGEMIGAGGPPDSYDWLIKIRFALKSTTS